MEKCVNTYGSCFLLRSGVKPVILSTTLRVSACDFSNCFKYSCISATFEERFDFAFFLPLGDRVEVSNFGKELGGDNVLGDLLPLNGVVKLSVAVPFVVFFCGVDISDIDEYVAMLLSFVYYCYLYMYKPN